MVGNGADVKDADIPVLVNYLFKCGTEFPESLDSSGFFFVTPSGSTPDVWALGDGCNADSASTPHAATGRVPGLRPLGFFARK